MKLATLLLLPLLAAAGDHPGVRPRASAAEYSVHSERSLLALGADLLSPDQVRGAFVSDLNRAYLVVEVGVYPQNRIEIDPDAFRLLVVGSHKSSRATSPRTVAGVLQKAAEPDRDITLYPTAGVGYESGPRGYDPMTGRTRGGGLNTSVGVGVGVGGGPAPASTDADRKTMEAELADQGLPREATAKPVSGYLYFPYPDKKDKAARYELQYRVGTDTFLLPFPEMRKDRKP